MGKQAFVSLEHTFSTGESGQPQTKMHGKGRTMDGIRLWGCRHFALKGSRSRPSVSQSVSLSVLVSVSTPVSKSRSQQIVESFHVHGIFTLLRLLSLSFWFTCTSSYFCPSALACALTFSHFIFFFMLITISHPQPLDTSRHITQVQKSSFALQPITPAKLHHHPQFENSADSSSNAETSEIACPQFCNHDERDSNFARRSTHTTRWKLSASSPSNSPG